MNVWKAILFTLQNAWNAGKCIFLLAVIARIFISLSGFVNALIFKEIVDVVTHGATIFGLTLVGVIVVRIGYEVLLRIMDGAGAYAASQLNSKIPINIIKAFIDKVATLDLASFENAATIGLIQRAFNRAQNPYFFSQILNMASQMLQIIISGSVFLFASPLAAFAIFAAQSIPMIVRSRMAYGVFSIFRADDEIRRRFGYTQWIVTAKDNLPEVKTMRAFEYFKKRLVDIYTIFTKNQLAKEGKLQFFGTLADMVPIIVILFYLLSLVASVNAGTLSVGIFTFYVTNVFIFFSSLNMFKYSIENIMTEGNFVAELVEFFALKPRMSFSKFSVVRTKKLAEQLARPTFIFSDVSFHYPNAKNDALRHINFTIPYGQHIALVGENGAGKTTLIKLLMRIYDPTVGSIQVNDIDIRDIPEDVLFSLYSTLFQRFGRFMLTIRENLEVAAGKKLSDIEAQKLLKFSDAWSFIKNTQGKIDQQLGPEYSDGIDLSGGEWQRLAIARAHAKKSPILILDEPTSAVDAKSEVHIFEQLNAKMKGNTLIFISHRFSTIRDAERIVVLKDGEMIEDGTHNELIAKNMTYKELYTLQAQRYDR